jgi:GNAT superfamily N-acetyltransferase
MSHTSVPESYRLRRHQAGDLGWIVREHALYYAREFGWNDRFEAAVAEIVVQFVRNYQPQRERCWIAETDAGIVGSAMLVGQSAEVAQLRTLLVLPEARGLGLGRRLIAECSDFAGRCGYRRIVLTTENRLLAARRLYAEAGYVKIAEEPYNGFGVEMSAETWQLTLQD